MLTGKMVRVRFARDRAKPQYIDTDSADWLNVAEQLLEVYRNQEGMTRGEIEADIEELFGADPTQLVHQGLAKLLEDRCEFETVSEHPPEEIRDAVFRAAADFRAAPLSPSADQPRAQASGRPTGSLALAAGQEKKGEEVLWHFDRPAVLAAASATLNLPVEVIEHGLFADLRSEQRLVKFKDISPQHLLERYNVALAQAVLLRSTRVHVAIRGESPARYRMLLRKIKFHRLLCEPEKAGKDAWIFHLDGPLSLFSSTQKYGLQLALFLPAVLSCKNFALEAEVRWGAQRKEKTFLLTPGDGLVSHAAETGTYVPPEVAMFAELFRKRRDDWKLDEETDIVPLGDGFWVPDFRLTHVESGKSVLLEILGFWRKANALKQLQRLRKSISEPFLLAVSDALHIEDADLEGLPAGIHRFRQMPLPDEVARLAGELIGVET